VNDPKIQILGLRSFFSKEKQKDITYDAFFDKGWRSESVADLFQNIEKHLEKIPANEQWNLYYTTATCLEEKGRKMVAQAVMPFDIDYIDVARVDEYVPVVLAALGVKLEETGVVFSGNGLQFIVGLKAAFTSVNYFDDNRHHYKAITDSINRALKAVGLTGEADTTVFSAARIMRLPLTENRKKDKQNRMGRLINRTIVPIDFDIAKLSGIPTVDAADHIDTHVLKRFPSADPKEVLAGCAFMKRCKEDPSTVGEQEWYAMLSVTARLPDGNRISHELSSGYPGYSHSETEAKIEQALKASGPRTCKNINKIWGKCHTCPHFEKATSPILLKGRDYIKTQDSGFHDISLDRNGNPKPGKPNYEDLRKFFEKKTPYVVLGESKICLTHNGKFWEEMKDAYLEAFAQDHFFPKATTNMTQEFKNLVCRTNLRKTAWFTTSTNRRINFQNGVLNVDTMQLEAHSADYGFRYVLPYAYDAESAAPRFEKFLDEVTGGSHELSAVLIEFAGYCFSNDECWAEKSLIMTGEGSNGKSTFMNVLRALAGKENYASLTLSDLKAETNRQQLDGRLFNLAEETPTYAMAESSLFKNLVTGGETTVKMLYKQPYTIANKCKLMFACNELPKTKDTTKGFFRRLLIVPFNREFEGAAKDPFLKEKLMSELPGIFNIVIRGYKRLHSQGRFTVSSAIDMEIKKYRLELDSVEAWLRDCVEVTEPTGKVESAIIDMYTDYKFWIDSRGEKPEAYITFAKRLSKLIPNYGERHKRAIKSGKKESFLRGVKSNAVSEF
jgi:P4 family phage/plasmid primase-like protien